VRLRPFRVSSVLLLRSWRACGGIKASASRNSSEGWADDDAWACERWRRSQRTAAHYARDTMKWRYDWGAVIECSALMTFIFLRHDDKNRLVEIGS
jgi:hypothetical protein